MSGLKEREDNNDSADALNRLLMAVSDKHGQVDVNMQRVALKVPGTHLGIEVSGTITLTLHMRDLTDDEKRASASKNVAMMSGS
jgi:hypothetical protein